MPSKRVTKKRNNINAQHISQSPANLLVGSDIKRPTRYSRGKSLSRLDEYDDGEGRDSSRQVTGYMFSYPLLTGRSGFRQWTSWLDSINTEEHADAKLLCKKFTQEVEKHLVELREFVNEQENRLEEGSQKFMTAFVKYHAAANAPSGSMQPANKKPETPRKENLALFRDVHTVLDSSRSLLATYKDTDHELKTHELVLPTTTWKKDRQDIKELLACGREYGEQIVERHLVPNGYVPAGCGRLKHSGHEQAAGELFEESRKALHDRCWGAVASEHIKQLKNMVDAASPKYSRR